MAEILVVEQDTGTAERIAAALRSDSHTVHIAESRDAAAQKSADGVPRAIIASATLPEVRELLGGASRRKGGPGSLVLIPSSLAGQVTAEDYDADALLPKPFSDDDLRLAAKACLEGSVRRADKGAGQALTSQDIFADVLAEVESTPSSSPNDDIQKKLEQTLSGVMPTPKKRRSGPKPTREATDGGINDLLDRTLSSLELPTSRPRKARPASAPKAPTPVAPAPAPQAPAPPAPTPPQAASAETAKPTAPEAPRAPAAPSLPPREALKSAPAASVQEQLAGGGDAYRTQKLPVIASISEASEGQTFGQFTLIRKIAVGGMAEVWLARRRGVEGFQKTVAIKKILSHLTGSPDFVTMFIDEAKLAAQLNHNNIIQIYDLGKVGEDFFIAMEFVDGKDLRSIIAAGRKEGRPLPIGLALMISACLARALGYAHRKRDFDERELGLVHRDVSPQNVLISYEGEIKLCDFGIVKAVAKASTTQMGALKGKLQYMSPEQAWGKPVDARSDIFSLGSVMFEMLTGHKLFSADSEIGVLDAVRECRIRSPRQIVPGIPEDVEKIVLKALTREPEDRYQTAADLDHEIQDVLHDLVPTPSQTMLATYMDVLFRDADPEGRSYESRLVRKSTQEVAEPTPLAKTPVSSQPSPTFNAAPATGGATPTPTVSPAPEPAVAAQSPASAEPDSSEKQGSKLGWILAAAVLITILAVVAFVMNKGGSEPETPSNSQATTAPSVTPTEPPAENPTADTAGADTETAGEAEPGAAAATPTLDLEALVEQELAKRREQLEEELAGELDEKKKRLEKELEEAQKAAKTAKPDSGGGG